MVSFPQKLIKLTSVYLRTKVGNYPLKETHTPSPRLIFLSRRRTPFETSVLRFEEKVTHWNFFYRPPKSRNTIFQKMITASLFNYFPFFCFFLLLKQWKKIENQLFSIYLWKFIQFKLWRQIKRNPIKKVYIFLFYL